MKYTTKSGLELPPEIVELVKKEQLKQGKRGYDINNGTCLDWWETEQGVKFWSKIYIGDFTEFYKLYPKKDLDSYGNEIVKGEMVEVADKEEDLAFNREREFLCIAEKSEYKYVAFAEGGSPIGWKFCRKIQSSTEVLKSELKSQMNDLLKQAREIEAKINEL